MKNLFFIALLTLAFAQAGTAQNDKFVKTMETNIAMMDTAHSLEFYQKISNNFERIAGRETKEWTPPYYVALSQIQMMSFEPDQSKWSDLCDKGDQFIAMADSLSPNNSEIYVVKCMLAYGRIRIDPMTNGQKYAPIGSQFLQKAITLNPDNPRAYLENGINTFYTPPMWGGGKEKAEPMLATAKEKFDAFKPANSIAPNWGKNVYAFIMGEMGK